MEHATNGMQKKPGGFTPYGPLGQGKYSRENLVTHPTADIAATYAIKAVDNIHYDPGCGRPFTICDFGAADGLSSLRIMNSIIENIRNKHGEDFSINIFYEDRPTSDFNSLFIALAGELEGPFASYQAFHQNIFAFATGRTFFKQCLPNESLHFGYSSTAMHYLSKRPCKLQDAVHVLEAGNTKEKAQFAAQAAKDWCTILLHRAKELAPGGQMLVCAPVLDDLSDTKCSKYEYLARPWKEMMREGRISQEDFAEMTFISIYRSIDEYQAPFRDTSSDVYKAGLRLVTLETQGTPCPVQTEWLNLKHKDTSSKQEYAKKAVAQIRCWANWLFVQALQKNRPFDESIALVEEFWKRFEKLTASHLDEIQFTVSFAYIWMEKIKQI